MESTGQFYTQAEVAEMFGVTSSAVRLWRMDGLIQGRKRGHQWHYPLSEIDRFTRWRVEQQGVGGDIVMDEQVKSRGVKSSASESATSEDSTLAVALAAGGEKSGQVNSTEEKTSEVDLSLVSASLQSPWETERLRLKLEASENEKMRMQQHIEDLEKQVELSQRRIGALETHVGMECRQNQVLLMLLHAEQQRGLRGLWRKLTGWKHPQVLVDIQE